jgi:hypothetical protein
LIFRESNGWNMLRTKHGQAVGRNNEAYNPSTGTTIKWSNIAAAEVDDAEIPSDNYYEVFGIDENEAQALLMHHDGIFKCVNIGAGIGGRFTNTAKLRVMNYHEAINRPDGDLSRAEVPKEHQRMVDSRACEAFKHSELLSGVQATYTTWAMKKKCNCTLRGRVNVQEFRKLKDNITISQVLVLM